MHMPATGTGPGRSIDTIMTTITVTTATPGGRLTAPDTPGKRDTDRCPTV
jgi:hypothetical protein